jgi:AcrR family transcriptional regulator
MAQRSLGQQQKREAVLRAAMEIFAERGYQGATVEEIARRAGVAKGTPYLYFSDKADLFYAVFNKWSGDILNGSMQALAGVESAGQRLLVLALSAVAYMKANRECFPLSLEIWAASTTPALRERFAAALKQIYAGYRREATAIIRAGQAAGELRAEIDAGALAAVLTGAVDGLFLQCWFDPKLNAEKLVRGFFAALLPGIVAPKRSRKA